MLRVSAVAEQAGFPTASLVCEGFVGQAKNTSVGLGSPDLPIAMLPGHPDVQSDEDLAANVVRVTVDQVIRCLTEQRAERSISAEPDPQEVVFEGTFEEVNRYYIENWWSDGLPIIPPTRARIDAFLTFTEREPHAVIGTLMPDNRAATPWNIAINGVMAGCRPEYMPILVALVEAMADPQYGVEHSGNTPGAETQIILNGPLIKELGFNYEQGALRDGFQPNATIGRFWRLMLRNVAGFLPHQNDKGTFGGTWRVVLAENEDVLSEIGWTTVAADAGISKGESAVTIARYTGSNVIVSVVGKNADECLPYLADSLIGYTGWELAFTVGIANATYRPLLVLSPIIAKTLANSGLTKQDVQDRLFDMARIPARKFEQYISGWTSLAPIRRSLFDLVALGKAPKVFGASRDPERLVPLVAKPDHLTIAVSGDPLRTNCCFMPQNGMLGFQTTRRVTLPFDWGAKLKRAHDR